MSWAWTMAGGWLLPGVLGGGLLLLVARALAGCAAAPARRQRLAEWGVAAALVALALSFGPRWLSVSLPPPVVAASEAASVPAPADPGPGAAPAATPAEGGWVVFVPVPADEPPAAPAVAVPPQPAPAAAVDSGETRSAPSGTGVLPALIGWLGMAHAVGAIVLLGRWLLGHVGLWRLLRIAEPVSAEVCAVCRSLCGDSPVPRLLQARRLRVPLSCGLWCPTIVLPGPLCGCPDAPELRWVLAHELTHLERRDAWGCLLFGLGEIVFYALPWYWGLRRQARLCRERVADAVAAQGGAAADYAQFLLNLSTAPVPPAGAMGVTGHTSDLFWRVAMLLHSPRVVEKRAPRLWTLGVAAGLLSLAALVAGVGLRADAAPADEPAKKEELSREAPVKKDDARKEEPKKEDAKKEADKDFPELEELLKNLREDLNPEQAKVIRDQLRLMMEMMRKARPGAGLVPVPMPGAIGGGGAPFAEAVVGMNPFGQPHDGRLGVRVKAPSATLVDQLDLPKGQGVVIEDVTHDSPAAKAGLKANDILLELNGKAVSSHAAEIVRTIHDLKANTPVDAVVLRKGKKETIKGIALPEMKAERPGFGVAGFPGGGGFGMAGGGGFGGAAGAGGFGGAAGGGFGGAPGLPAIVGLGGAGANGVMTTVIRNGDRFTARHQEGSLIVTVTGTVADGKATTKTINVQDGNNHEKYESIDKVPEQYRDKVKNLIEMGEKGAAKVEIK